MVAADLTTNIVTLITGLAWPVTVLLLVFTYRRELRDVIGTIQRRVAQGHKFTALGITVEAPSAAPIPAATSSGQQHPATARTIVQALGLGASSNVLIALGETAYGDDESALIGSGDALGLALVQATLLSVGGIGVTTSVIRKQTPLEKLFGEFSAVVGVGGPWGNRLSAAIMDASLIQFEFVAGAVHDRKKQRLHRVEFTNAGMDGIDWAILAFLTNPHNRAQRAAIAAGYSGYGTNAASVIFSMLGNYPAFSTAEDVEALVRVKIVDGVVDAPEVIEIRRIG